MKLALIGLIVTVAARSVSDTIPTEVLGRGILICGGRLLSLVAPASGQVELLDVRVGDLVQPGQVVARIRPLAAAEGQPTAEISSASGGRVVAVDAVQGGVVQVGGYAELAEQDEPFHDLIRQQLL